MSKVIIVLLTLVGVNVFAAERPNADAKDIAKIAQVSDNCGMKILAKTTAMCNAETKKKDKDRLHQCFYSSELTSKKDGVTYVTFTVGDSDEWTYDVRVSDEADQNDCTFDVQSEGA